MRTSTSKSSIFYAILSNTIVLVLIGFFLLLYFHTNSIINLVKENINILVELKDSTSVDSRKEIMAMIAQRPEVQASGIQYIPSSDASKIMGEKVGNDLAAMGNPFKDIISFNIKAEHYSDQVLASIKTALTQHSNVLDVFYENVVIDNVKTNLYKLSFGVLTLSIVFVILAIIIIYNTINLSLYADRWEIKTMEIIGARDGFIRQPYLKIAGSIGIKSAILASLLLLACVFGLYLYNDTLTAVFKWYYLLLTLVFLFVISLSITIIATISIVNKYLSKAESELY